VVSLGIMPDLPFWLDWKHAALIKASFASSKVPIPFGAEPLHHIAKLLPGGWEVDTHRTVWSRVIISTEISPVWSKLLRAQESGARTVTRMLYPSRELMDASDQ
jgi:hypothetical protein